MTSSWRSREELAHEVALLAKQGESRRARTTPRLPARNNLALVLEALGELAAARSLLEQALAADLKTFGEDHPTVAGRRNNLALVLRALGELAATRSR